MIRRSGYQAAGPYDRRLTNLQDLDMWIRTLASGELHVLRDRLTTFRVRANNGNLSAPRLDSQLRAPFEYAQILRRFLTWTNAWCGTPLPSRLRGRQFLPIYPWLNASRNLHWQQTRHRIGPSPSTRFLRWLRPIPTLHGYER